MAMPKSPPPERDFLTKYPGRKVSSDPVPTMKPTSDSAAEELATLYAALDNIENGIILLDKELRAQYANPAVHAMFKSPQQFMDGKPLYAEMLQHARRNSSY